MRPLDHSSFRAASQQIRRLRARWPRSRIVGQVDSPRLLQRFVSWVDVAGWAFSLDEASAPLRVEVIAGGKVVRQSSADLLRPDVERLYAGLPASRCSGFSTRLAADELPDSRSVLVTVRASAMNPDGGTVDTRLLGGGIVRRVGYASHVRREYRHIWDRSASNEAKARIAVSGTPDIAEWERTGEASASFIASQCLVTSGDVVLEVGCGAGRVGAKLAPRCGRWIGGDVSPRMLAHAAAALRAMPNVSFVPLTGTDLAGIADRSVDVAYSTSVFMHLDEWDRYRYVSEMYRVLRPGGRVYYDNFNLLGDEGWALFLQMSFLDPEARPSNISKSSTPQELERYAYQAGFTDVKLHAGPLWVGVSARKPAEGS